MNPSLNTSQTNRDAQIQTYGLSQDTILSCSILSMGVQELSEFIYTEALENPLISLESEAVYSRFALGARATVRKSSAEHYDDDDRYQDLADPASLTKPEESSAEALRLQIPDRGLNGADRSVLEYMIASLDNNGYLTESSDSISALFDMPPSRVEELRGVLKSMEPVGIGASDLRECLLLQLAARYPNEETARIIIVAYLDELAKNQIKTLARKLKKDVGSVMRAAELIRSLEPRPGRGKSSEQIPYVIPEIIVDESEAGFTVRLSTLAQLSFGIDPSYASMPDSGVDEAALAYIQEKRRRLNWIKTCIDSRNDTLSSVALQIVREQSGFFLNGPKHLKPLKMKDIADTLDVHESTVSRAVKGKHLQCKWGVFELKYFFSNKLYQTASQQNCLNAPQLILELIEHEPGNMPYSDQRLKEILAENGIELSRRTIAKYRESSGIKNSNERRHF